MKACRRAWPRAACLWELWPSSSRKSGATATPSPAALAGEGKLTEAIAEYQQALKINPDFSEARGNIEGALAAQRRQALKPAPDPAEAHNDLGNGLAGKGRLTEAKGVKGRQVRLYSNGNTDNKLNHYPEIEVFGKPAA